ncbi:MAG: nucleotidyltransferase domain-containing protein [Tannerella sp.]|jgi:predicted nucleotidyltransferase|nr:nucleotidyltransferase domain-containing protein [Tannerella sp.]
MKQSIVNKLQDFFPAYPIEKAWVFGSYARSEETRKSDIDILVRFDKDVRISLFDYAGIALDLEDLLHKKVDLVEEGQLLRRAQESAEHDKILVYERYIQISLQS